MQNNQVNGGGNVQMNNNESANNISEDFDNLVASKQKDEKPAPKQTKQVTKQPKQANKQVEQPNEEDKIEIVQKKDTDENNGNESSVISSVSSASGMSSSGSDISSSDGDDDDGHERGHGDSHRDSHRDGGNINDAMMREQMHMREQQMHMREQQMNQQMNQPVEQFNNQAKNGVKNEIVVETPVRTWNQFFISMGVLFVLFFLFSSKQVESGLNAIPYLSTFPYYEQVNLLSRGILMILIYVLVDKFVL